MEPTPPDDATDEFFAHTKASIDTLDQISMPADVNFTLEQVISEAGHVVSHFHLRIEGGTVSVENGSAEAPDITLRQDAATARSLQEGTMHAQGAFLTGRLSIDGDIDKLLVHGQLLNQLLGATTSRS